MEEHCIVAKANGKHYKIIKYNNYDDGDGYWHVGNIITNNDCIPKIIVINTELDINVQNIINPLIHIDEINCEKDFNNFL